MDGSVCAILVPINEMNLANILGWPGLRFARQLERAAQHLPTENVVSPSPGGRGDQVAVHHDIAGLYLLVRSTGLGQLRAANPRGGGRVGLRMDSGATPATSRSRRNSRSTRIGITDPNASRPPAGRVAGGLGPRAEHVRGG